MLRRGFFMNFGLAGVAAITVVAYLACSVVKATRLSNQWLPLIAGGVGGIMGIICLLTHMQGFPATDPISAFAVGIVSGLAATGVDQAGKQMTCPAQEPDENSTNSK
jgi:hypothetical protein